MGCRGSKQAKANFRRDDDASTVTNQLSATQRRVCLPPLSDDDNDDVDDASIDLLTTKVLAEFNARLRPVRNIIQQWVDGSFDADGFPNTPASKRRVQLLLGSSTGEGSGTLGGSSNMVGGVVVGPRLPQQHQHTRAGFRAYGEHDVVEVRRDMVAVNGDADDDESTTTCSSTSSSRSSRSSQDREAKALKDGEEQKHESGQPQRHHRKRGWQARVSLLQQASSPMNGGNAAPPADTRPSNSKASDVNVANKAKSCHPTPSSTTMVAQSPNAVAKAGEAAPVPLLEKDDPLSGAAAGGGDQQRAAAQAGSSSGAAAAAVDSNQSTAPQLTPIKFTVVAKVTNVSSHTVMTYRKSEKVLGKGSSATVYLGSVTTVTTLPPGSGGSASPSAGAGLPGIVVVGDSSCSGSFEAGVVTKKFMTAVKEILVSPAAVMLETPDGRRKKTTHLYKCGESLDAILTALRHEFKVLKALDGCPQVVRVLHIAITTPGAELSAPPAAAAPVGPPLLDLESTCSVSPTVTSAAPPQQSADSAALTTSVAPTVDDAVPLPFRPQRARMFLEYVKHGTLLDEAKRILAATVPPPPPRKPHLHELTVRAYMRDVLLGLVYLHEHKVLHRDVKPHNILVHSFVEDMYDTVYPICLEDPLTTFTFQGERDSSILAHVGQQQGMSSAAALDVAGGASSPMFFGDRKKRATAPAMSSSSPQPGGAAGTQDSQGGGGGLAHPQSLQYLATGERHDGRPATASRSPSTSNAAAPLILVNSIATAGGGNSMMMMPAAGRGGPGATPSQSDAPLQPPPQSDGLLPRPELFLLQSGEVTSSGESFVLCDRDTAIRETIYPCLKSAPHGNHRDKYKTLVKLTDFGSARWAIPQLGGMGGSSSIESAAPSYTNAAAFMMQTTGLGAKTTMNVVGTAPYLAPEAIRGKFSTASDVWSFAITFLELVMNAGEGVWDHLNARDPFQLILRIGALHPPPPSECGAQPEASSSSTVAPDLPRIPSRLSSECQRMLRRCLSLDPLKRPSTLELLQCKYFYRADWIPRALDAGSRGKPGGIEPLPELVPSQLSSC